MAREPTFGERMGSVAPKALQLDSVDDSLRMAIWNHVYRHLLIHRNYESPTAADRAAAFYEFLRWDLAEFTELRRAAERLMVHVVHMAKWWQVYEFLECALRLRKENSTAFAAACNRILEEEAACYRVVGRRVVPLVNAAEVAEVNDALEATDIPTLQAVHGQLNDALSDLAKKPLPDNKGAVHGAISATESLGKIVAGNAKGTFSSVLPELAKRTEMPDHLQASLKSLWLWTCNEGVRHGTTEPKDVDGAAARYAVISCSALINFVIAKLPDLRR